MHDIVVIGGGPSGSVAAREAASRGMSVLLLEAAHHPRFHIGESFLPETQWQLDRMGLGERVARIPHTVKKGASFAMGGDNELTDFRFRDGLSAGHSRAFNIERAPFDAVLLQAAEEAGVQVVQGQRVRRLTKLDDRGATVETDDASYSARLLFDASGPATVVGRHLGTRQDLPDFQRIAYFDHVEGVSWRSGEEAGYPIVVMCEEGWFWFIPLDGVRVSVGLVLDADTARRIDVPPREMLRWGLARCPFARQMTRSAELPEHNRVAADFTYTCRPYAGPGYFLLGDAATFLDPVFSTGVCLGMRSAESAAEAAESILSGKERPAAVRRAYANGLERVSSVLFRLVRRYYSHSFRELFLHGEGPFGLHRAVIGALTGDIFPRPGISMRWRLRLFDLFVDVNRYVPLVPRREPFSLLEDPDRTTAGTAR